LGEYARIFAVDDDKNTRKPLEGNFRRRGPLRRQCAREAGDKEANGYVPKPFDVKKVLKAIREQLSLSLDAVKSCESFLSLVQS
jgi:hypothetical protein